jgi:RNA polymerase sigma-70 factor (ECF subfamily)
VSVARARADSDSRSEAAGPVAELDEVTLRLAQRGEQAACRALVERYQRPVFALLHRMLGAARGGRVEDLAQDTFLQVFRALAGFAPLGPARLSTWILTIASRRAIDELRRDGRGEVRATPLGDDDAVAPGRADDGARGRALAGRVAAAVDRLAPEQRAALLLREYHGLEYAEIARALDIEPGTVKSRLSRARAELRRALADERDGAEGVDDA